MSLAEGKGIPLIANDIFEQVTLAIGAHRQWKQRLQTAIQTGQSTFNPTDVCADNRCEFGKWLHGLAPAAKATLDWKEVQKRHACFHQEASVVLTLALRGDKAGAEKRMGFGGPFAAASADLTAAMMKWKTATAA